ncbi:MAG TPA: hypothetical protein VGE88_17970, partial [Lysobacter sp.]
MNTVRLTAMQRYYLEALGRQGRTHLPAKWDEVENRLAYCWYASGFAGDTEWEQVRHIVKQSWRMSKVVRAELGSVARL